MTDRVLKLFFAVSVSLNNSFLVRDKKKNKKQFNVPFLLSYVRHAKNLRTSQKQLTYDNFNYCL